MAVFEKQHCLYINKYKLNIKIKYYYFSTFQVLTKFSNFSGVLNFWQKILRIKSEIIS